MLPSKVLLAPVAETCLPLLDHGIETLQGRTLGKLNPNEILAVFVYHHFFSDGRDHGCRDDDGPVVVGADHIPRTHQDTEHSLWGH